MNIELNETWCVSKFTQDLSEIIQVVHRPSNKAIRDIYYWDLHYQHEVIAKLKKELIEYLNPQQRK